MSIAPYVRNYILSNENTSSFHTNDLDTNHDTEINIVDVLHSKLNTTLGTKELSEDQQKARFLQQATMGFSMEDVNNTSLDFESWINDQIQKPASSHREHWRRHSNPNYVDATSVDSTEVSYIGPQYYPYWDAGVQYQPPTGNVNLVLSKQFVWYTVLQSCEDLLRQRVAWALSQVFVIGENGLNNVNYTEWFLKFYDIFVLGAFTNFEDILLKVTFSPLMGQYLTYLNNRKYNETTGIYPDENYAREVMQLFSIGLWELNQDGTHKKDSSGKSIPTYTNENIQEFARIFTGMVYSVRDFPERSNIEYVNNGNRVDDMRILSNRHDFGTVLFLDGTPIEPNNAQETDENAEARIRNLIHKLFLHPNTPPFFAKLMIQRLTCSNPTPQYVKDVADAFVSGTYNGSGSGQRGDMIAIIKSILLHPYVRNNIGLSSSNGKLQEPLVKITQIARAFNLTANLAVNGTPVIMFVSLDQYIGQAPYKSPSVFNFYSPEYQPSGFVEEKGFVAPEFEIQTDFSSIVFPIAIQILSANGLVFPLSPGGGLRGSLDYSIIPLTSSGTNEQRAQELIDYIDIVLTAGRMTAGHKALIKSTIAPSFTEEFKTTTIAYVIRLVSLLPEYNVIY